MIKTYQIKHSKIKKELTIFLISDLHYSCKNDLKKYQKITESLEEKPDLLVIAGDLLDCALVKDEDLFLEQIKNWAKKVPVLIGIGNHDITIVKERNTLFYWKETFFEKLKSIKNVYLLDQESYETEEYMVTGITLPYAYYYTKEDCTPFLKEHIKIKDPQKLQFLLIHASSSIMNYPLDGFDFVLSGHNHNGMVPVILEPIMKNRGIISPGKKWLPKNIRGTFFLKNTQVIISGGITKLSKRSKLEKLDFLWNREITKITIKPAKI